MKACHFCGFYSDGWCSYRNQGASPGGSCSNWCSSSRMSSKKSRSYNQSGTSKKKGKSGSSKREALGCGTCTWWHKWICTNPDSQAYGKEMTSGALCTAYQHEKGDALLYFPKVLVDSAIRRNNANALPQKKEPPKKKDQPKKSTKEKRKSATTSPHKTRQDSTSTTRSKPSAHKKPPLPPLVKAKTKGPHDHCNRCQFYKSRICYNDWSCNYNKQVHPLDWCDQYERLKIKM